MSVAQNKSNSPPDHIGSIEDILLEGLYEKGEHALEIVDRFMAEELKKDFVQQ